MHINRKTNPLPADIQKFIDESKHGAVYFSLGGNLNPSVMPKGETGSDHKCFVKVEGKCFMEMGRSQRKGQPEKVLGSSSCESFRHAWRFVGWNRSNLLWQAFGDDSDFW